MPGKVEGKSWGKWEVSAGGSMRQVPGKVEYKCRKKWEVSAGGVGDKYGEECEVSAESSGW